MSYLSSQASERVLSGILAEVLQLQTTWDWRNTPEMQRRGLLVRNEAPTILRRLLSSAEVSGGADLKVEGSDGAGRKARIPWIRIFSEQASPAPTKGWYLVYLFAADGSALYLSLNQGTRDPDTGFGPRSAMVLEERVAWAREVVRAGGTTREEALDDVELNDPDLGASYEAGNVVAVRYPAGAVPDDQTLAADLSRMASALVSVYEADRRFDALPPGYPERRCSGSRHPSRSPLTRWETWLTSRGPMSYGTRSTTSSTPAARPSNGPGSCST